ncbi:penicillin-binding protein 1A [Marinicellulosiphila megalodicopiae]|uniref:penicillin-binding protein 1A n=1 Tax=Marinicellulosiphila megalodicopiae TaxID=2724896 RepID=UPI003BAF2A7F
MKLTIIFAKFISLSIFMSVCVIVLICSSIYIVLAPELPDINKLKEHKLQIPLSVYSNDNHLIAEFGEKRRTPVTYEQIPVKFVQALIATEDKHFEYHNGIDLNGILRSIAQLLSTGEQQGGGSTLTQQVVKNILFTRAKTFQRKFAEIITAIQIEKDLSKQEIFELYVNKHFLGHNSYGIQAAADVYYGKNLNNLTLAELAMIAGLHQSPSYANPISYPENAKKRRNVVLGRMLDENFISKLEYDTAVNSPVTASKSNNTPDLSADYIAEMARAYVVENYSLESAYTEGFKVYTTIESKLQNAGNFGLENAIDNYTFRHGYHGAEQHFETEDTLSFNDKLNIWKQSLKKEFKVASLSPAVVINVDEKSIQAILKNDEVINIDWDELKWASRFLTTFSKSEAPNSASDILQSGDLIRVVFDPSIKKWKLTQIPKVSGALVALNPQTGAVVSLVGGYDFKSNKFNHVTQAKRQPGSNFKPFIYTAALHKGYSASSLINDAPLILNNGGDAGIWRPKNAGDRYLGLIPLRQALYQSRNIPAVRLLRDIGIDYAADFTQRFGFNASELNKDLTLILGSTVMSPLQIVTGYATFANGGYKVEPYFINRIEDRHGNILFQANPKQICSDCLETPTPYELTMGENKKDQISQPSPTSESSGTTFALEDPIVFEPISLKENPYAPRVLSEQEVFIMQNILQDVVIRGTATRANKALNRDDLAGKTGTTNDAVDAWFTGFNGDYVASVWIGHDSSIPLGTGEFGGSAALPAWIDFMKVALEGKPSNKLSQPPGIISLRIDPSTGLLAHPGQSNSTQEIFRESFAPTSQSNQASDIEVDIIIDETERLERQINGEDTTEDSSEIQSPEMLF